MYVSRLLFATRPGQTHRAEEHLQQLRALVERATGTRPRILRAHFASLGSADLAFEQEATDLGALETQMHAVMSDPEFAAVSGQLSQLLVQTPKREIYQQIA